MQKSVYLIISGLLCFGFFKNNLFPTLTPNVQFFIMLAWSIWGWLYYKNPNEELYNLQHIKWAVVILILFFLSSLTPLFRYNQDLFSTWIAMRTDLLALYFITLLKISPDEEDIFKSFKFLGILAVAMAVLVALSPNLFVDKEMLLRLIKRQKEGSTDVVAIWPGSACAVFYFYILLQKMSEQATLKNFALCTIFAGYIFLMQNRSTMLCAIPFYLYVLLRTDIKYKSVIITMILLVSSTFLYNVVDGLINETQNQLSNAKYNRWQAISFFLLEQKGNLYTMLFGNGVPSNGSSYLAHIMQAQRNRLAFVSDIGLLGTYFYYGLAMMFVIYKFVWKAIRLNGMPIYLRYYCWWILLVPTIHSLGLSNDLSLVNFSLIFYLVTYYENKSKNGCIDTNSQL